MHRSSDGVHFTVLGTVPRDAARAGAYDFADTDPVRDHNYYRIAAVSSSATSFTPAQLVYFREEEARASFRLYPDPATSQLTVELPRSWVGSPTALHIYNAAGALVWTRKMVPVPPTVLEVQVGHFPTGTYTIHAVGSGESRTAQFVRGAR